VDEVSGTAGSLQVNHDGVHNEQSKPHEEVEAEEEDIGGGRGGEEEGQEVHPGDDGDTIGDQ